MSISRIIELENYSSLRTRNESSAKPIYRMSRIGMLKHASIHTPRCSRRFGIPAEHYHKSFLPNSMIRLSMSNLLCGRNAAPPTIANWHAKHAAMRTRVRRHPCLRRVWRTWHTNVYFPNYRIRELFFFTNTKRKFGKANMPNGSNWHAIACFHTYPTLRSRRFGIPAEHYHKSFLLL